ncbi:site-2 protease family protein [Actibacterium lipolyticum]|uniref:Zinc metalloprotease n=1 Tax=Actibacterium lipolyticum TaxID=1524263 RepID=A0A238KI28_9RHOB|nr:site-2 protease family protein [Actibacterium lipolyticum]SMX42451.1 Putative zinc metalloprotease Rip3 [Actibacterium lipolyticum]
MHFRSVKLITLLGCPIKADPSWFLLTLIVVWSFSTGYFPQAISGFGPGTYLPLAIAALLGLILSLLLHELSHTAVARHFGVGGGAITLFLFGGVGDVDIEVHAPVPEFWVAAAGPAISFVAAAGFWVVGQVGALLNVPPALEALINCLVAINLGLALINLLPAYPLDGGRMLRALLWQRSGDLMSATRHAVHLTAIISYTAMAVGVGALFAGAQIGGIWVIIVGLSLLLLSRGAEQRMRLKTALRSKTIASIMTVTPWTVAPSSTLAELVNRVMLHHAVSFVPVVDGQDLLGYIDIHLLKKIDREHWPSTTVGDVFISVAEENAISPHATTKWLVQRVLETGRRKFLVTEAGQLRGVITLSDLAAYLSVFRQLDAQQPDPDLAKVEASGAL